MDEIWKDIEGYEGLYQVSNYGRIKSICHSWIGFGKSIVCKTKERIMLTRVNKVGYEQVTLCKNNKPKTFLVHRLVAMAFIPNNNNLPQINHKNCIKTDNMSKNLEWCDSLYNNHYSDRIQKASSKTRNGVLSKPVLRYSLDGELISEYPSAKEASRQTGFNIGNISNCCNGRQKTAYGSIWKYKEADD